MRSFEKIKIELSNRLDELLNRQGKVDRDLRRLPDPDSEDRAQEAENDEVLESLETKGREEIALIRRALAAIQAGVYGVCTKCGAPISEDRLRAQPFAEACIDCAD